MAKRKNPEDQSDENQDKGNDSEDSFGLPDIEYKPLDETNDASSTTQEEPKVEERYVYTPPVEEKSKAPLVIGLVIGAVIIIAGFLIYHYVYVPGQERAKQEQLAKQKQAAEKAERDKQARLAKEQEEARQRAIADSLAIANAKPAVGAIETLSERTRRYYVVISTAIDDDLVMDYARKLSKQGVGTKIIPPFGKTKFYRLAIADHDTYAKAQANADEVKGNYGSEVWVVRF
jgi:hypothetical protein